jgi:hypothetical protein
VLQTSRKDDQIKIENLIVSSVETTLDRITPGTVIVPTTAAPPQEVLPVSSFPLFSDHVPVVLNVVCQLVCLDRFKSGLL